MQDMALERKKTGLLSLCKVQKYMAMLINGHNRLCHYLLCDLKLKHSTELLTKDDHKKKENIPAKTCRNLYILSDYAVLDFDHARLSFALSSSIRSCVAPAGSANNK